MELFHVVKSQQWNRRQLEDLFAEADEMEKVAKKERSAVLAGKIMISLFYEPSTRTRLSFESGMLRLGGQYISTENAREFSSAAKGESLEDTIRVLGNYGDVIVLRHYEAGSAERAAALNMVPIINAGDGPGQHPTQALLDLYTIKRELGHIDGLTIALVGDLANGRAVRSLAYLLAKYDIHKIYFVSPALVSIKEDIKEYLRRHGIPFEERLEPEEVAPIADVIYQTRIQKERFGDRIEEYREVCSRCIIDNNIVGMMKPDSILLHPLPRVNEISREVDSHPRAAYFRQSQNALYIRMALLKLVLFENNR